jgi:hypothetical protein
MNAAEVTSPAPQRKRLRLRAGGTGGVGGANPLAVLTLQPRRADAVWTRAEWTALCVHLHNANENLRYVMGFRDEYDRTRYVRSKRMPFARAISWAWTSISGSPRSRLAYVPFSTNDREQSRWGGLDFDAHQEGQADRARELAFAAFRLLLNVPDLCLILETSGSGGWHLWAISTEFHSNQDWIRFLKSVAGAIGAPISAGICEIFPPDSLPSKFGKGMRAPGCYNPRTESCSQIIWENTRSCLESVLSGNSKTRPLICSGLQDELPDIERSSLSLPPYRGAELLQKLGITAGGTRNGKLASLVGEVFHQVGHAVARRLAEDQFRTATVRPKATQPEHMASFEQLWTGLASNWAAALSPAEREVFTRLETENERDAFRIVRSFERKAKQDGAADFPIVRDSLAARLGISGPGAAKIRDKLAKLGAIRKTANYVPNKFAARFKWLTRGPDGFDK